MSDNNLFSFPEGSVGQAGGDIFDSAGFTDLGSDNTDNPFVGMTAPASADTAAGTVQTQEPAPQPQPQQAPAQIQQDLQPQPIFQHVQAEAQPQTATVQTAPQQTPPPVQTAPQTAPTAGNQPQTSAAAATEEPNPLLAAMYLQDQSNARKAAAPVFAQLPVFSYNGNEEPIENTEQTFEELRLANIAVSLIECCRLEIAPLFLLHFITLGQLYHNFTNL